MPTRATAERAFLDMFPAAYRAELIEEAALHRRFAISSQERHYAG